MSLSEEQLSVRASALSARDYPAILGLDPYSGPIDVWLKKTGVQQQYEGSDRLRWGNLLEPVIRSDYESRHGVSVIEPGTLIVERPIVSVAATPDGLIYEADEPRGLEIKTHSLFAADYGEDGTDEVPVHVAIQCQIGMFVTGMRRWDAVAFWDGLPHEFRLYYDKNTAEAAIVAGERFWVDHVLHHRMPQPDGTRFYDSFLKKKFRGGNRDAPQWVTATPEIMSLIRELRELRAVTKESASEERRVRQNLEAIIGDADGIEWDVPFGDKPKKKERVTWRKSKDASSIDYRSAMIDQNSRFMLVISAVRAALAERDGVGHALDIISRLEVEPDYGKFTTVKPGTRRFVVPRSWSKDDPQGGYGDRDDD